jgi:hypothetical protein
LYSFKPLVLELRDNQIVNSNVNDHSKPNMINQSLWDTFINEQIYKACFVNQFMAHFNIQIYSQ